MTGVTWNPFLRWPRLSLALAALACLPLLLPIGRVALHSELRALLAGDERSLASYEQAREILGDTEAVVVSVEVPDLFSPAGLATVRRISDALESQPGVLEVRSLTHAVQPVRRGLSFEMVPLVSATPGAAELERLRAFCLTHPLVRNVLVGAAGRHTLITVTFDQRPSSVEAGRALLDRVEAALAPFRAGGLKLRVLALPRIEEEIRATLRRDLGRFVPAALGVVLLVLGWTFRSWTLLAFALANQALVLALLPGVVAVCGFELNVFSVMLVPLLTGVHLTLLTHLLTALQRASAAQADCADAFVAAVRATSKPAAISTLTTIAGLLSLATGLVPQMREFGWLGTVCLLFVHAFTFGPGLAALRLLAGACPRAFSGGLVAGGPAKRWPRWLAEVVERRARWIGWGAVAVCAFTLSGLAKVRTDIRVIEALSPASETRQALAEVDREYGGINVVQIELDSGRPNGLNDPAFLRYLDDVHRHAAGRPEPTGVFSYAQLLAMANQIWSGGGTEALQLPTSPVLIGVFATALRAYDFPFTRALADADFQRAQLVIRTRDLPAADYLRMIREIGAYAEAHCPAGVTVSTAKGLHTLLEADRRILRSQVNSLASAVAAIGLALAAFWRSVRLALLAVVTNAVPVGFVLALSGWLGWPLNSITVMMGAIALGIVEDDTVHFLTHWRDRRRAGAAPAAALRDTLDVKGRPILATTGVLVGVFALFGLSSFPPVRQFGLLLAAAFVAAQVAVLVWLPALLRRG